MKPKSQKKGFYFTYSIIFLLMSVLVFSPFFLENRTFVGTGDGWEQHFRALLFYSDWLRELCRSIFIEHTFQIPSYTFGIGYGGDALTTLSYYAVGDPLNLFSVFVPKQYMVHFYDFLVLLRIYLAGISFYWYLAYRDTAYRKVEFRYAALAGAMLYDFCGYSLLAAMRHPFFINPMICFPLVLLGVEKIKKEKKPAVFILAVFVSGVSNYYFFYMIVLFTVFYVIFRIFMWYDRTQIREAAVFTVKLTGYALIGVMMGMFLLGPIALTILQSPRLGADTPMMVSYPLSYLGRFLGAYLTWQTPGRWTLLGFAAIFLPALFLLFEKRGEKRALKIGFTLLTAFLLAPVCGYVFSGFSNITNRWCWCYALLAAYILTVVWKDLYAVEEKQKKRLIIFTVVYAICSVTIGWTVTGNKCGALLLLAFSYVVLFHRKICQKWTLPKRECVVFCLMLCNICITAFFEYAPSQENYVDEFMTFEEVAETMKEEDSQVLALSDDSAFYRYTGVSMPFNSALTNGLFGIQSYWSLTDGRLSDYYNLLALHDNSTYRLRSLDSRTVLNSLAGVKYFVAKNKGGDRRKVPYGYKLAAGQEEDGQVLVYENEYALPFAYTYSSCLSMEEFEAYTPLQRQEALLQSVVLENDLNRSEQDGLTFCGQKLEYEVVCDSDSITLQGNSFVATEDQSSVTLTFDGLENAETYFYITGLDFAETKYTELYKDGTLTDPRNLYRSSDWQEMAFTEKIKLLMADYMVGESDRFSITMAVKDKKGKETTAEIRYLPKDYIYYCGRHDFLVNLYYGKQAKTAITITFPYKGIYSFDTVEIFCLPMDGFADGIDRLKQETMENLNFHMTSAHTTNRITGTIRTEKEKILYLSMSYSDGWTAYVDGSEQELLQANVYGSALLLDAGTHEIELVYQTPGLREGMWISLAGCLLAVAVAASAHRPLRRLH